MHAVSHTVIMKPYQCSIVWLFTPQLPIITVAFPCAGNLLAGIIQDCFEFTLSRKFELFLCISYYRIRHNFSDSFLDILSAVFITCTCCVPKTCKVKAHQHPLQHAVENESTHSYACAWLLHIIAKLIRK